MWIDLFTPGLNVNMKTYKSVSLLPMGSYIFRPVIGNKLGNSSYNSSAEFDISIGEHHNLLYNYNKCIFSLAIPGQPSKPIGSKVTSDSITLSFDLEFIGTGIVKQFILRVTGDLKETQNISVDNRINSFKNIMVTVNGLEADSTYRFQVAAVNDVGKGPFSEVSDEITTGS